MPYTTTVPGLPGGPIVTNHPIKIKLIAASNTYQRPGAPPPGQRIMIQHGTGNARSMAAGEATWLVDQRASGNQQSYHYITDDRETWVCLPINEHGWHAADGGGPGNMLGIANEMVENADLWASESRALRAIENAAEIMGITAARMKALGPKQHWDYNYNNPPSVRHDCPNKLRHKYIKGRKCWDIYVERYRFHEAAEKARMGGGVVPGAFKKGDTVKATDRLNVRQGSSTKYKIVKTLNAGDVVTVKDGPRSEDGYIWYDVTGSFGSGWAASNWLEKTVVVPEKPKKIFTTRYELPFRKVHGFNGPVLRMLPVGTRGEIVGPLVERDGLGWYPVKLGADSGFIPASILYTVTIEDQ